MAFKFVFIWSHVLRNVHLVLLGTLHSCFGNFITLPILTVTDLNLLGAESLDDK
jgi:hypothetical protein